MKKLFALLALATLSLTLTAQTQKPTSGYWVSAHDSATEEWTIIRVGNYEGEQQRKKFIVTCRYAMDGSKRWSFGPDACHLRVGQILIFKLDPNDVNAPILNVDDLGDTLLITEGTIHRPETQLFHIKKSELLPSLKTFF